MVHRIETLNGDEIRQNFQSELGYTKDDRVLNNRLITFMSKLLNRDGILTIVAMITPFREAQQRAQEIVEEDSLFVLI